MARAAPAPGSDCAGCHPRQTEAHSSTRHARALRSIADTEFAKALPDRPIAEARDGYLFSYAPEGFSLGVIASREGSRSVARALITFAFGAGDQGVTPVLKVGGKWIEHRISYYPKAGRYDLTLGHRPGPSRSGREALGIEQPAETMSACFGCHATVTAAGGTETIWPGVKCERCHPGASEHALRRMPVTNPAKLEAGGQMKLCATCHRLTPPGAADDPLNIRFQPLRLALSKCYQQGQLVCTTCHPAHQDTPRDAAAFYRDRCVTCHAKPHREGDCAGCHMPKSSPAPYLTFSDHYIRPR